MIIIFDRPILFKYILNKHILKQNIVVINMNVKTLCLSILFESDATGYEIRQLCTNGQCSYFVEVSFGSIYPALAKLEEAGFVTSHTQAQQGRPAKKIYSITQAGRDEFRNSLFEKLNEDVFRSEFLLFARFASLLPASLVKQRINERLEMLDQELDDLKMLGQTQNPDIKPHGSNEWILNYGLNMRRVEIEYIKTHMNELISVAQADKQLTGENNK